MIHNFPQGSGEGRGQERVKEQRGEGEAQGGEQELATKMLQIQSKRFYLDVKENKRGKFIKVAEISADGRRSQIFLALSTAAEFRDQLSAFSDFYSSLGPPSQVSPQPIGNPLFQLCHHLGYGARGR